MASNSNYVVVDEQALTNVFICELVRKAHPLRLVLHGLSIHDGMLELLNNRLVNGVALARER